MTWHLIIDQGGHSSRALLFDENAVLQAAGRCAVETVSGQDNGVSGLKGPAGLKGLTKLKGIVEQDTAQVAESVTQALAELATQFDMSKQSIASAGLITQRSSFVACTKEPFLPITPIISWQDTRNQDWLNSQDFDIDALRDLTGLQLNAHFGASKMRWLLDHNPQVREAADNNNLIFLPLAAWLKEKISDGKSLVVDAATACRTFLFESSLCQTSGEKGLQWSSTLLDCFSLSAQQLPDIVHTDHHYGYLSCGEQRVPLRLLGGDQSFLPFAWGEAFREKSIYINIGTGAFIQAKMTREEVPEGLLCSLAASTDERSGYFAEGTVNAAAAAVDFVVEKWNQKVEASVLEQVLKEATDLPLFKNALSGLGSPFWCSEPSAEFIYDRVEQQNFHSELAAVLESIVFLIAINVELLCKAKGQLQQIVVSGGLSRTNGLCQCLADCTGLSVLRYSEPEASAKGAVCFLAGIQSPAIGEAEAFSPQTNPLLLNRYQRFKNIL